VLWSACSALAACSGVVEHRPRVRPAAIHARDLARRPCAPPSCAPSASWCFGLLIPLSGPPGGKRARTPGRYRVARKQAGWLGCARGSAPTGPAVKTSNPCLSPRGADRAVGGIRTGLRILAAGPAVLRPYSYRGAMCVWGANPGIRRHDRGAGPRRCPSPICLSHRDPSGAVSAGSAVVIEARVPMGDWRQAARGQVAGYGGGR
jgi:hypothetical protein